MIELDLLKVVHCFLHIFVHNYRHCIVCDNGIYFLEGMADSYFRIFLKNSRISIEGICVVALALALMTTSGFTF